MSMDMPVHMSTHMFMGMCIHMPTHVYTQVHVWSVAEQQQPSLVTTMQHSGAVGCIEDLGNGLVCLL